jgi:hypothetical protein
MEFRRIRRQLRGVESNHGFQDQNLAGCHLPHPGSATKDIYLPPETNRRSGDLIEIATGICDLILSAGDVHSVGQQAAGFGQVLGAFDA